MWLQTWTFNSEKCRFTMNHLWPGPTSCTAWLWKGGDGQLPCCLHWACLSPTTSLLGGLCITRFKWFFLFIGHGWLNLGWALYQNESFPRCSANDRESVSLWVDSGAVAGHVSCRGMGEAEEASLQRERNKADLKKTMRWESPNPGSYPSRPWSRCIPKS